MNKTNFSTDLKCFSLQLYHTSKDHLHCKCLSLLVVFFIILPSAYSVALSFEGGDWHNPSNWSNNMIPDQDDDVIMLADGIISRPVDVNNINVSDHKLTILGQVPGQPAVKLCARSIFTSDNGEILNNATIILSKGDGTMWVDGTLTNQGTISFTGNLILWGSSANLGGTITGSSTSAISVGSLGTFTNQGSINGAISSIQVDGTGIFANYGTIVLDSNFPSNLVIRGNGRFINFNTYTGNSKITIDDDGILENKNFIDFIHTGTFQLVRLNGNAQLRNYGNIRLDLLNGYVYGIIQENNTQFENRGLIILKNAALHTNLKLSGVGYFRNLLGSQFYISNTSGIGLLSINSLGQFQNLGLLSLCQTNQTTGTCPIIGAANFENLSTGQLFTGVDIFSGNCHPSVPNSIINHGVIFPACATDPDFTCLLNYAGANAITGTISGPQGFEAHDNIESDAFIDMGTVTFDAGTSITLLENFEVNLNTVFEALIDGCGGI